MLLQGPAQRMYMEEMGNNAEDSRSKESAGSGRERISAGTAEDVAALFTWANLQGARYWDFSESRRRYRQQVRECAAAAIEERRRMRNRAAPGLSGAPPASVSNSRVQVFSSRAGLPHIEEESSSGPQFLHSQRYPVAEEFVENAGQTGKHQPALLWEPAPVRTAQEPLPEDAGEVWRRSLLEGSPEKFEDDSSASSHVGLNPAESDSGGSTGGRRVQERVRTPAWIYDDAPPAVQRDVRAEPEMETLNQITWRSSGAGLRQGDVRLGHNGLEYGSPGALVIVFSQLGGVGRTSLLATLGCALARAGERVTLGDTMEYSSLPLYFGAREVCLGLSRAFASPLRPADPPVFIASYDLMRASENAQEQRRIMGEILRNGAQADRILLDLPASAGWLFRRLATLQPTVLVPIVPDVDAVLTLDAVERFFEPATDPDDVPIRPVYLLSQFDSSLALHRDVREILEHQLGPRLLGTAVRSSALVREALREGLTVLDYAPQSAVAQDYFDVAGWLQTAAPAAPSLAHAGGML